MPADPDRRQIHAYVTDEAHEAWHRVAAAHGVNVSALLEAVGMELAAVTDHDRPPMWLRRVVRAAAAVQTQRFRRPRRR